MNPAIPISSSSSTAVTTTTTTTPFLSPPLRLTPSSLSLPKRRRFRVTIPRNSSSAKPFTSPPPPSDSTNNIFGGKRELTGLQPLVDSLSPMHRLFSSSSSSSLLLLLRHNNHTCIVIVRVVVFSLFVHARFSWPKLPRPMRTPCHFFFSFFFFMLFLLLLLLLLFFFLQGRGLLCEGDAMEAGRSGFDA